MQDHEFTLLSSRLAPALFAAVYCLSLMFLLDRFNGYLALGACSAWLLCAAFDLKKLAALKPNEGTTLRFCNSAWQRRIPATIGRWHTMPCRLRYSCPAYLLLEWPDVGRDMRWQLIWRDALTPSDWHRLKLYLSVTTREQT